MEVSYLAFVFTNEGLKLLEILVDGFLVIDSSVFGNECRQIHQHQHWFIEWLLVEHELHFGVLLLELLVEKNQDFNVEIYLSKHNGNLILWAELVVAVHEFLISFGLFSVLEITFENAEISLIGWLDILQLLQSLLLIQFILDQRGAYLLLILSFFVLFWLQE